MNGRLVVAGWDIVELNRYAEMKKWKSNASVAHVRNTDREIFGRTGWLSNAA